MNVGARTVLLTGATGGLGHAIARRLAAAGARLVLSGRRGDVLAALASELGAEVAPADLSDRAAVRELAAAHTDVDIVVANAGIPASGRLRTYDDDQIERALLVNLHAPIILTHALAPHMVDRGCGHFVFMSSLGGKTATAGSSLYNATKFGLRGFAGAMRAELHGTGVGVSTIFPGFIRDAGMFADAGIDPPPGMGTSTPGAVADGVVRAIESDRAEVQIAPPQQRALVMFGHMFPSVAARVQRGKGASIADNLASGQSDKR
jgi:short-subunit dehydrogenase